MVSYTLHLLPTTPEAAEFYKPTEGSPQTNVNAGFDLFVPERVVFTPGERKLVSMRVKAVVTNGEGETVHYWMPPRSSISKTGLLLLNSIGVIDRSYRGELMSFLWNTTDKEITVQKGDRLVQIVSPDMGAIDSIKIVSELDETSRGEGGFGSTGR